MSTNCVGCLVRDQTGTDLLCDECREQRAIRNDPIQRVLQDIDIALPVNDSPGRMTGPCGCDASVGVVCEMCFTHATLAAAKRVIEQLRDKLIEMGRYCNRVHPRVWKLIDKGRNFIVIGEHEPYYLDAYAMIQEHEMQQGTWTEEDRIAYMAARLPR
jgi:hypothetical protein